MFRSLQVCGTSGSGKTTLVRRLLEESNAKVVAHNEKGTKPIIYEGRYTNGEPIFFMGSYETVCGGCDTIPSVKIVAQILEDMHHETGQGLMVFEGLMISHMIGTVGDMQKSLGMERHWRAYLDTSLHNCLQNVVSRRQERGQTKPFNPTNTQKDWPRVKQSRFNWEVIGGVARTIRYNNAWADFNDHIKELYNV